MNSRDPIVEIQVERLTRGDMVMLAIGSIVMSAFVLATFAALIWG